MERNNLGQFKKKYADDYAVLDVRMTRKQNRSCKLTEDDIEEIQWLLGQGWKQKHLADMYEVSPVTIRYWIDEDFRKTERKRNSEKPRGETKEQKAMRMKEYHKYLSTLGLPYKEKSRVRMTKRRREYREKTPSLKEQPYTFDGKTMSLKEWARYLDIPYTTLYCRIKRYKLPLEKCFVKKSEQRVASPL